MPVHAVPLRDAIGSEIHVEAADLSSPEIAAEPRRLPIARGVLVFRGLHLPDARQVALAGMMGTLRPEGENGICRVTLDTRAAGRSTQYLKGSFHWHLDGTHDTVPPFASLLGARKPYPVGSGRLMHRTTLLGEGAFA